MQTSGWLLSANKRFWLCKQVEEEPRDTQRYNAMTFFWLPGLYRASRLAMVKVKKERIAVCARIPSSLWLWEYQGGW